VSAEAPLRPVEEARAAVLAAVAGPLPAEALPVEAALGRVLAEPVRAAVDLPPWDNSAMDGYALRSADVAGAAPDRPVVLEVVGDAPAGRPATATVGPGTAVRIATGAPIPAGADAVVPVEETRPAPGTEPGADGGPPRIAILTAAPIGYSIRRRASDVAAGRLLLDAGAVLTPAAVALVAGAGVASVAVHRRPVVAVLATGDEVRRAGEPLGPVGIPDANGPGLRSLARAAGAEVVDLGVAADRLEAVVGILRPALERVDVVVVSGGVSVGPYDVVRAAFERLGSVGLWRVAIQPGKPFAFGTAERPDGRTVLLFGLPGNPVSSFVTFDLFVRPALRFLAGRAPGGERIDPGVLVEPATKSAGRRAYLRVAVERDPDGRPRRDGEGRLRVRLAGGQGSHVLSALAAADAYAIVPEPFGQVPAGTAVDVWWLEDGPAGAGRPGGVR
jgi:molybdenum cofactor synthesis domain-containing protein